MAEKKLTAKQEAFVREYLLCRNASEAMRRAGYTSKNPDVDAPKLLVNPGISEAIRINDAQLQKQFEITQEKVIAELAAIAFFNMKNVMRAGANGVALKVWGDIPDEVSSAIAHVSESNSEKGNSYSIRAHDKIKALELLGKHTGLWKDKDAKGADQDSRAAVIGRVLEIIRGNQQSSGSD